MELQTHLSIDESVCGRVVKLEEGFAEVILHTHAQMVADDRGLVHGGFVFGAADYAAMAAVNDPNVVLGAATCRFLAPVKKGQSVIFDADVVMEKGKKKEVEVKGYVDGTPVFEGTFTTFVLDKHVLD